MGFAFIVPLAAISFWAVGVPIIINLVLTALCAIVGGVQIASTFRAWRAESVTEISPDGAPGIRLPGPVLAIEVMGLILLALGGAAYFSNVEILPDWAKFEGYVIVLLIAGSAAVLPALIITLRLSGLSRSR